MNLEQVKDQIRQNKLYVQQGLKARHYQNTLIKPKGSLGHLEDISVRLAEMTGQIRYNISSKHVLIMCADHGFTVHDVSAYPRHVTGQMARAYLKGTAAASVIARANGAHLSVFDVGIDETVDCPGLNIRKIREGTRDFTKGPAMTKEETLQAIGTGFEETRRIIKTGAHIIAPGEMGIGNTTASSALLSVFSDLPPEQVTGRGSLINDATLKRKTAVIQQALQVNHPSKERPLETLAKVGGYEIAAMTGCILACAVDRVPVVIDGFIAGASALTATFIAPGCARFMFASHMSAEPAHRLMLEMLGLTPLFHHGHADHPDSLQSHLRNGQL